MRFGAREWVDERRLQGMFLSLMRVMAIYPHAANSVIERVYATSTEVSTIITFPIGKRILLIKIGLLLTDLLLGGIPGAGCAYH